MRKMDTERYLIAALITLGIFLLGLMLGFLVESKRVEYIQYQTKIKSLDFSSLQLQYTYIDQMSQEQNCPAVLEAFDQSMQSLEKTRLELENYNENAQLNKNNFDLLLREYTLAQLRFWLFAKQAKNVCDSETTSILYFFSSQEECSQCDAQAFILTYLKKKFGEELLIFSLDARKEEEPLVRILKKSYNITTYPTLIIGNKKFEGLISKAEILNEI